MFKDRKDSHLCVLCNSKLESKDDLKEHFRKHANKEIDSKGCPVGPNGESVINISEIKGRGYYVKGSASKFVIGDIICDVCGKKFNCNTAAIQHKFRQHPHCAMKFYCPQCGAQFPLKLHRDNHLAEAHQTLSSHLKVPCQDCGEIFYNKEALEYHYTSTHKRMKAMFSPTQVPPPSKKIKMNNAGDPQSVYYCHICGFEYIVKFNLQKHLERQHTKEERENTPKELLKCTTCDALFSSQKAYINHNMYHRPDDLYVTSEQQRLQTVKRVDQDFDYRRVQNTAAKFIQTNHRQKRVNTVLSTSKDKIADHQFEEMSPPTDMDSSSDSDCEIISIKKRVKTGEI